MSSWSSITRMVALVFFIFGNYLYFIFLKCMYFILMHKKVPFFVHVIFSYTRNQNFCARYFFEFELKWIATNCTNIHQFMNVKISNIMNLLHIRDNKYNSWLKDTVHFRTNGVHFRTLGSDEVLYFGSNQQITNL